MSHVLRGLRCRYPACCVLRFAFDRYRGEFPAMRRGVRSRAGLGNHVPCGWLHKADWKL